MSFENLTNESFKGKHGSQFELVNYVIEQTRKLIRSGRNPRVKIHSDNPAVISFAEVVTGKDQYVELTDEDFDDEEDEEIIIDDEEDEESEILSP